MDQEKQKQAAGYENMGHLYLKKKSYNEAIESYLKFLVITEELGDQEDVWRGYSNLGYAYESNGQYRKSIDCYKKTLKIAEELGDKSRIRRAYENVGIAYRSIGQYQIAIEYHAKTLEICKELGDKALVGSAYFSLGIDYCSIGEYPKAIDCHYKYLGIAEELGDREGLGKANANLGKCYSSIRQHQMAIECYKKLLEIAEEMGNKAGVGEAHANLGMAYRSIGHHQMSIDCHKKTLQIAEELGDKEWVGRVHSGLGTIYWTVGQYPKAIDCHKKHLAIAEELCDKAGVGRAHANQGAVYWSIGEYQMAKECLTKHLKIAEEMDDRAAVGAAHGNLGIVNRTIGQYHMAIESHKKHLEIAEELGDEPRVGQASANLGNAYESIGQYQSAIGCYRRHLEIAEELGEKARMAGTLGNLGIAYHSVGQYQLAIESLKKSLEIAEELGVKPLMGRAHSRLGIVYCTTGQYLEAIECHQKHLAIADELGDKAGVGGGYGNLGNAYNSIGEYEMAIECQKKHLDIAKKLGDKAGVQRTQGNLGSSYNSIGQFQMAIECHEESLKIAEEVGDVRGTAQAQAQLGRLHQGINDDQASRLFAKSILDYHSIRRSASYQDEFNTSMSNMFAGVHRSLVQSLLNLNQVKAALLVSDNGKATALYDLIRKYVDVVVESELEDHQVALFKEISGNPSSRTVDILLSEIIQFQQHSSIISYSFDSSNHLHIWVISRYGVFHKQWQTSNGTSTGSYLDRIVKTVRKSLLGAVREYYIPYPENYGCHSKVQKKMSEWSDVNPSADGGCTYARDLDKRIQNIFTDSKPKYRLDYDRDPSVVRCVTEKYHLDGPIRNRGSSCYSVGNIEQTERNERMICDYYSLDIPTTTLSLCSRGPEDDAKSLNAYTAKDVYLEKLYSVLIAPIVEHLAESKLVIVPDGPLFLLPFSALYSRKEGHLCEKYSLQFTPALQVLNASSLKPLIKFGRALFVGNPTVGEVNFCGQTTTVTPLPNATVEARECAKCFDAEPLLEEKATKAKVLRNMEKASIIHIAAHGHMDYADIFLAPNKRAPKPPSEEYYLLTAKDVLGCRLNTLKTIVLFYTPMCVFLHTMCVNLHTLKKLHTMCAAFTHLDVQYYTP